MPDEIIFQIDDAAFKKFAAAFPEKMLVALENALERVGLKLVGIMKEEVPVDTGNMRKTVFAEPFGDLQLLIYPFAEYAPFVQFGTRPSPGRYVPAIGKRLINPPRGMHPGTRPNDFRGRTMDVAESEMDEWIDEIVIPLIEEAMVEAGAK